MKRWLMSTVLLLVACAGGSGVLDRLDTGSRERLAEIGEDDEVLVSFHHERRAPDVARHAAAARPLGETDGASLWALPKSALVSMPVPDGLHTVRVWGDADAIRRLAPDLRNDLLERFARDRVAESIPLTATFDGDDPGRRDALVALGVQPRSVTGTVATLDADAERTLALLTLPSLLQLEPRRAGEFRERR